MSGGSTLRSIFFFTCNFEVNLSSCPFFIKFIKMTKATFVFFFTEVIKFYWLMLLLYPGELYRLLGASSFIFLDVLFRTFDVILQWRQNMCQVMSHEGKYCTFNKILVRKAQISVESYLSLSIGVTKVNFMWCVFHNAQFYDIDLIIYAN